jgi:hypothetical protein
MPESERMLHLRRTRARATLRWAARVHEGDLLHTPSAVLEVVSISKDDSRVLAKVIDEYRTGITFVRPLNMRSPGSEFLVTSKGDGVNAEGR